MSFKKHLFITLFLSNFLSVLSQAFADEGFYYHINDHLGNCRVIVDEKGVVQKAYDYYPFGMQLRTYQPGDPATFTFTGKQLDQDGGLDWYYFGARFYDPEVGRFLGVDPHADSYLSLTPYHYVANNPLTYIDPTGMDTLNVTLPQDRNQEGTLTLTVNGVNIALLGGDQILGKGTTNGGTNPTRDASKENGNTPTGTATITEVFDRDIGGHFVNADGTPAENPLGQPSDQLIAQGRFFLLLNPESGQIKKSGRTELGLHGGGTALGANSLQAQQPLVPTLGCGRITNQTTAQIATQVINANENSRVFRVMIQEQ